MGSRETKRFVVKDVSALEERSGKIRRKK